MDLSEEEEGGSCTQNPTLELMHSSRATHFEQLIFMEIFLQFLAAIENLHVAH